MRALDIIAMRFAQQQLLGTAYATPTEIVAWMGAMQAQDFRMSLWAVGLRLPGSTRKTVMDDLESGMIVRTHVLRPTWHLVAAQDVRWMLALTADRIKAAAAAERRRLELDESLLRRTTKIIEKKLFDDEYCTRDSLIAEIRRAGIPVDPSRAAHIMIHVELLGLVGSGPQRGGKNAYFLLDAQLPPGPVYTREEALFHLAGRYFRSHGPATVRNFQWWSGLSAGDARRALALLENQVSHFQLEGESYWYFPDHAIPSLPSGSVTLLPAFDEYIVAYKNRSAVLSPLVQREVITVNGIFKPVLLWEGAAVGHWRVPPASENNFEPEIRYFDKAMPPAASDLRAALDRWGAFCKEL